jgi:hypothetical protein
MQQVTDAQVIIKKNLTFLFKPAEEAPKAHYTVPKVQPQYAASQQPQSRVLASRLPVSQASAFSPVAAGRNQGMASTPGDLPRRLQDADRNTPQDVVPRRSTGLAGVGGRSPGVAEVGARSPGVAEVGGRSPGVAEGRIMAERMAGGSHLKLKVKTENELEQARAAIGGSAPYTPPNLSLPYPPTSESYLSSAESHMAQKGGSSTMSGMSGMSRESTYPSSMEASERYSYKRDTSKTSRTFPRGFEALRSTPDVRGRSQSPLDLRSDFEDSALASPIQRLPSTYHDSPGREISPPWLLDSKSLTPTGPGKRYDSPVSQESIPQKSDQTPSESPIFTQKIQNKGYVADSMYAMSISTLLTV